MTKKKIMLRVSDITLDLIQTDQVAFESLQRGLLNLSAYADKIHLRVENMTKKPVQKGTIVVALSRIAQKIGSIPSLIPEIKITDLSIKSSLASLTFEKTADIQRKIAVLHPFQLSPVDLYAVIEGVTKVTLICSTKSKEKIIKHFNTPILSQINNLAAITVQFPEKLSENSHFGLISTLASKRVNIIEIITTFNEVSFIVNQTDAEKALAALNPLHEIFASKA